MGPELRNKKCLGAPAKGGSSYEEKAVKQSQVSDGDKVQEKDNRKPERRVIGKDREGKGRQIIKTHWQ